MPRALTIMMRVCCLVLISLCNAAGVLPSIGLDDSAQGGEATSAQAAPAESVVDLTKAAPAAQSDQSAGRVYPLRWVFFHTSVRNDADVERINKVIDTAKSHGLNGAVLSVGLDGIERRGADYIRRIEQIKQHCDAAGIEAIATGFSAGYGGGILGFDRNLAEGLPVVGARYKAADGKARLDSDFPVEIVGGDFEDYSGNRVRGCRFHDAPGKVSFVDTQIVRQGKASLRFEKMGDDPHGHGRVMFEVAVKPRRCYRVSAWVRTEELAPANCFRLQVLAGERSLAPVVIRLPATADWQQIVIGFNSLDFDKVRIYAGTWSAKRGRFWVDDMRIEEVGLVNVLRRPGTPLKVTDESGTIEYEEGRDFAPVADRQLNFRFDHDGPPLVIPPGSRIAEGAVLRVNYYHGVRIHEDQVSICMSEPVVYDYWRRQVELIHKHLRPRKWLLAMDEIRAGGSCAACKARGLTMAQILGDCITKQCEMIRRVDPQAEVWCWSDMLDPNHNARDDYYLVEGSYDGSWNHVPRDLRIVCWYYEKRKESLAHFSKHGFATLAGAYYDGDTLDNPKGWLEVLDRTPNAQGIMYTTWRDKYELLGAFGDLVSQPRPQSTP